MLWRGSLSALPRDSTLQTNDTSQHTAFLAYTNLFGIGACANTVYLYMVINLC